MSKLRVSTLESRTGSGTIEVPTGNQIVGDVVSNASGAVVQMVTTTAMPTSHITTTTTTEASVPLIAGITPKFSDSKIQVEFFSTMFYGVSTGPLITLLYRRINGGSWVALTPYTASSSRYTYGWSYSGNSTWYAHKNTYIDSPGTTGLVEYVVNYRLNNGGTGTSYLVHQYMEYGYVLTEIAQ